MAKRSRPEREKGHRGVWEKAKKKILATQTVCGICGKPVDRSYKSPHPLSATVDHIIPVSRGGHPTDLNNLQLAHRCCNREKSDKILRERDTIKDEQNMIVANDLLELHADWTQYKA